MPPPLTEVERAVSRLPLWVRARWEYLSGILEYGIAVSDRLRRIRERQHAEYEAYVQIYHEPHAFPYDDDSSFDWRRKYG